MRLEVGGWWRKMERRLAGCLFGVVDGDGADEVGAGPGAGGGVPDAVSLEAWVAGVEG